MSEYIYAAVSIVLKNGHRTFCFVLWLFAQVRAAREDRQTGNQTCVASLATSCPFKSDF